MKLFPKKPNYLLLCLLAACGAEASRNGALPATPKVAEKPAALEPSATEPTFEKTRDSGEMASTTKESLSGDLPQNAAQGAIGVCVPTGAFDIGAFIPGPNTTTDPSYKFRVQPLDRSRPASATAIFDLPASDRLYRISLIYNALGTSSFVVLTTNDASGNVLSTTSSPLRREWTHLSEQSFFVMAPAGAKTLRLGVETTDSVRIAAISWEEAAGTAPFPRLVGREKFYQASFQPPTPAGEITACTGAVCNGTALKLVAEFDHCNYAGVAAPCDVARALVNMRGAGGKTLTTTFTAAQTNATRPVEVRINAYRESEFGSTSVSRLSFANSDFETHTFSGTLPTDTFAVEIMVNMLDGETWLGPLVLDVGP